MRQDSTKEIMQSLAQSVFGTSSSVMSTLQLIDEKFVYLPLWHGIGQTVATELPLFVLVDSLIRILRGIMCLYEGWQLRSNNSKSCLSSEKASKYIDAFFILMPVLPECLGSYQNILNVLTTGCNLSLNITPFATGLAFASLIDMVGSMKKMCWQETKEFNKEIGRCFSRFQQETLLNAFKMIGWLLVAAGSSSIGWPLLILCFTVMANALNF